MYRAAWVAAAVLVVVALFTLGSPDTPKLSPDPPTFDGEAAFEDVKTIVEQFPERTPGSDADNRAAIWVGEQFQQYGLEPHIDGFAATVNGQDVALQNVWAVSEGRTHGTIILLANRDVPPLATQGAGDNASGVAALLELAQVFTVIAHDHTIVFVCTTGDSYGALGASAYVRQHDLNDVFAVIALRDVARQGADAVAVDGWSDRPKTAPPWLWLLTAPAALRDSNLRAELPTVGAQVLRLAVPVSAGSQGPFVAAGIPSVMLSAAGPDVPPQNDTIDSISEQTLTKLGTTTQNMVMAIDGMVAPGAPSGGTIFLTSRATLPGGALSLVFAALLLPLVAVAFDLYAHCRKARLPLRPALVRAGLQYLPWFVCILVVYFLNLVGLLPQSPHAVIPPDSRLAQSPGYFRTFFIVALIAVAYVYVLAVQRRRERRSGPPDIRATVTVSHLLLLAVALLILLMNPFAVLIVIPAAILWPLARPGDWERSIVPVSLGLVAVLATILYYVIGVGSGWKVWWYLFLLFENRTLPSLPVLLAALFFSTTGVLASALYLRGSPHLDLSWSAVERRRRRRPGEGDIAGVRTGEVDRARRRSRSRNRRDRGPRTR